MKKFIVLLVLSTFILGGCATKSNNIYPQQVQQQDNEDEIFDMDSHGKTKKSKTKIVKPNTNTNSKVYTKKPSTSSTKKK